MSTVKRVIDITLNADPSYVSTSKKAKHEEDVTKTVEMKKEEEVMKQPCSCPACPARTDGKCAIKYFELDDKMLAQMTAMQRFRNIVCACTAKSCNRTFPECTEVRKADPEDSDQEPEINSCGDCMSMGCHRTCPCCGESGNDGCPHDEDEDDDEDQDDDEDEDEDEDENKNVDDTESD